MGGQFLKEKTKNDQVRRKSPNFVNVMRKLMIIIMIKLTNNNKKVGLQDGDKF